MNGWRRSATERLRRALPAVACGAVVVLLSLIPRLPTLANAEYTFTSDEAVDALVVRHWLLDGEFALFNWDTRYYGIVEGILAVPWVLLLGWQPLAFKLGALTGLWLLALAVFLLGRQLWGAAAGAVAAIWILFVSPQFATYWTLLAAGGYALVVAWGVWTLLFFERGILPAEAAPRRWAAFGLLLGFGMYIYQLFAVYLALFAFWWLTAAVFRTRRDLWRGLPALAGGVLVGWSPQLIALLVGAEPGRAPQVELVGPSGWPQNLQTLWAETGPILLGVRQSTGVELPAFWLWLAIVAALLPLGALVALAWRAGWKERPWGTPHLLCLLVPLNAAMFVASRLHQDLNSTRYLLPALPALALALGWAARRLAQDRRPWFGVAVALAVLSPSISLVARGVASSSFYRDGRIRIFPEPLTDVVQALRSKGIDSAYAPYWIAYKATFLADEQVIFDAPDWSRYPPYAQRVDASDRVAWVFAVDPPGMDDIRRRQAAEALARFERRLRLAGLEAEQMAVGPYRLFMGPRGRRLLPPPVRERPRRLARAGAEVEVLEAPGRASPGERFTVRARFTNRSDGPWTVEGDWARGGSLQVNASYRWLDAEGRAVVEYGERSPLPHDLRPGASVVTGVEVQAPAAVSGRLRLRLTLVQEDVAWFDAATGAYDERLLEFPVPDAPGDLESRPVPLP